MTDGPKSNQQVLVLHGPSLSALGRREPSIYGTATLRDIDRRLTEAGSRLGVEVRSIQTNHEGGLIDAILAAPDDEVAGIIINPGAHAHTSLAIADALRSAALPAVEVHLTNILAREDIRRTSLVAQACVGVVAGFGADSYVLALRGLVNMLNAAGKSG